MLNNVSDIQVNDFYFRLLTPDMVNETYLAWVQDPEVTEFLALKNYSHTLQSLTEFVKSCNTDNGRWLFAICSKDNEHIGNFSIYDINPFNKTFDFGYFIGNKSYWGGTAGHSACLIGLKISFEMLGLRKTFTYVEKTNLRSRFVLQKLGFINEATLKNRVFCQTGYIDSIIYSLTADEWKNTLKPKYKL